jgi:hypothetical protein
MSRSASRQKRQPPARMGPIRNPLASAGNANPGAPVWGVLESGVRTAYDVIEEYMRRGYEAASGNSNHQDRRGPMNDNRTNYTNWQNPWGPMSQLTDQWLMAMRMWTEAWSAFIPNSSPQQPWNPAGRSNPNGGSTPRVSVQVSSRRPAEVTANLMPGADLIQLVADALQHEGIDACSIDQRQVSISGEPGRVRISVRIDPVQPAGRYFGTVRNRADGNVAGDLTIVITESHADSE